MAYDKNRNNNDDPVFAPAAHSATASGPIGLAPSGTPVPPIQRVALAMGDYPVGGDIVTLTNPGLGVASAQRLLYWSSPDGIARKGTLILECTSPRRRGEIPGQYPSVYCLVTVGTARGKTSFWQIAPALVPVEATYVSVDAQLAPGCGMIGLQGAPPSPQAFAQPPPFTSAEQFYATATAQFLDNASPNQWPTIQLGPSMQSAQSGTNNAVMFSWPAIVRSAVFSNNNATAGVWMVIADAAISLAWANLAFVNATVFVPAKASVSLGEELLGSFSNGVMSFGVTSPDGSQGQTFTEDTNDANVFLTLRGQQLNFGT
jgi:hypothetical protein